MMALASACCQPDVDTAPRVALLAPDVPVSVTGGDIVGAFADGSPEIVAFKGVPYAAPPVGGPPLEATRTGRRVGRCPRCDGSPGQSVCRRGQPRCARRRLATTTRESEDCLFLNIWAPTEAQEPLPVMVWIHGGGFFNGAGSLPLYDGTGVAERGVVLVTINYRVGVFGFLRASRAVRRIAARCLWQLRSDGYGGRAGMGAGQHRGRLVATRTRSPSLAIRPAAVQSCR